MGEPRGALLAAQVRITGSSALASAWPSPIASTYVIEHLAGVEDFEVAMTTYRAARQRWPGRHHRHLAGEAPNWGFFFGNADSAAALKA
jgi:hypothetical protein